MTVLRSLLLLCLCMVYAVFGLGDLGCSLKVDREKLDQLADAGVCDGGGCVDAGDCKSQACCTAGCWDGISCLPGNLANACGSQGAACSLCNGSTDQCQQGRCVSSRVLLSMSASAGHTCVADDQQRLWCWGDNTVGQLAADPPSVAKPLVVATGGWIDVAAGGLALGHTCAIHSRGSLWCWGDNSRGQLGLGPAETRPSVSRVTQVNKDAWLQVSAGGLMTCAIREDGTLWCWGAGDDGRLGVQGDSSVPRIVGTDRDWRSISAGAAHACAIKQDNSLWCWGSNANGRLGRSDVASSAFSARPGVVGTSYASVSAGSQHTCGIRLDKTLWCWGRGTEGQLGQSAKEDILSAKQVGLGFVEVSAGGAHTCAVRQGGALLCWGKNDQGQLGLGTLSESVLEPSVVASNKLWLTTVAGGEHSCAMADDGTLWCWGAGNRAQTGLGAAAIAVPTLLPLL